MRELPWTACLLVLLAGPVPARADALPAVAAARPELLLVDGALRLRPAPGASAVPLEVPGLTTAADDGAPADLGWLAPAAGESGDLHLALFPGPDPGLWFVAVVATYEGVLHDDHVRRDGRLWRLRLPADGARSPAPLAAELVRTEPDADFASGANRPGDAKRLYSGATGLSELDLRTLKPTRIVRAPTYSEEECDARERYDIAPRVSADGRRIWFTRGGFCGYEGDFDGQRMVFDVAGGRLRAARPVATVAVGPDGTVWYGDAAPDDEPLAGPSHAGWLFRAADGETRFRHVAVRARGPHGPELAETAVVQVLVDPADPRRLVVRTARVWNEGRGGYGGNVYESRDAGATWSLLVPPLSRDERDLVESDGLGVREVAAPGGSLEELVLYRGPNDAWIRRGGRWKHERRTAPERPAAPAGAPRPDRLGVEAVYQAAGHPGRPDTVFAATSDGLYRSLDAGQTWERVARGSGVGAPGR